MRLASSQRKLLLGGGAAAGILIFLAIIVAIQYIALQNPKRWDLTRSKRFTLSSQSKNILETFKKNKTPIELLAFYESKDQAAREEVRDLLDRYRDVYLGFQLLLRRPRQRQGSSSKEQDRFLSDSCIEGRGQRRADLYCR